MLETFLVSVGSSTSLLNFTPLHTSRLLDLRICLWIPSLCLDALFQPRALTTFLRHPFLKRFYGGTGLSTSCPSSTPFGLDLGPDLPWADEPSPGILRFTAGEILTLLLAYLYRHSLLYTLHVLSQLRFVAVYNAPLPIILSNNAKASVLDFSPVTFSAQNHSISELLRTL